MGLSKYPSKVNLPMSNPGCITVLDYLVMKFPFIAEDIWRQRLIDGKVHWLNDELIDSSTLYVSQGCVCYYREVEQEPVIPFEETVIFQDDQILVACKPHFLQVTPGGNFVDECLQNRLRRKTGNDDLQALHRLDRETAGLVLFSVNPETRSCYHALFEHHKITKTYQALAGIGAEEMPTKHWVIKNRLEKSNPSFVMHIVPGVDNAHSVIDCVEQRAGRGLFELSPVTGKTHQLRVHMASIGHPIMNDKVYPILKPKTDDDFSRPLQLLAKKLMFIDPITQAERVFYSDRSLLSIES